MLRCIYIVYIYSQDISVFSNNIVITVFNNNNIIVITVFNKLIYILYIFYCLYHMFLFTALLDTLSFEILNNLSIMIYDLNSLLYLDSVAKLLY